MHRKLSTFVTVIILASMFLVGCAPAATAPEAPAEPEAPAGCGSYKAASVEFQSNIFYDSNYQVSKRRWMHQAGNYFVRFLVVT